MITIQNFDLGIETFQSIDVPAGAGLPIALFKLNTPHPTPTVWFVVDDSAPKVKRVIYCIRAGDSCHEFMRKADHIGTIEWSGAILHYFAKRFT